MGEQFSSENMNKNYISQIITDTDTENISFQNNLIIKEAIFPGMSIYINDQQFKTIGHQKDNSICKIIKNKRPIGTGFLCSIPGKYITRKVLITAYHVLGEDDLNIGNELKISFKDNAEIKKIKIDNKRHIYSSKTFDITIIEILSDDNLAKEKYLELDPILFNSTDFNKEYANKPIYILHYPKGFFSSFSDGIIGGVENNNTFRHYCPTNPGSSGAPILNLDTLKVIGIHLGTVEKKKYNVGFIIKEPINIFNKENEIKIALEINADDVGEKIYFLGKTKHYEVEYYDKINEKNALLIINNERCPFNNYIIKEKPGIYTINIILTQLIDDCAHLFDSCKNIVKIDFSSFNSTNVKDMGYMFSECINLKEVDFSNLNTSNVKNMESMFFGCQIKNLDLSSFNTINVENMSSMFNCCYNLESLNLSSFNMNHVIYKRGMFFECNSLENLDFPYMNTIDIKDKEEMSDL